MQRNSRMDAYQSFQQLKLEQFDHQKLINYGKNGLLSLGSDRKLPYLHFSFLERTYSQAYFLIVCELNHCCFLSAPSRLLCSSVLFSSKGYAKPNTVNLMVTVGVCYVIFISVLGTYQPWIRYRQCEAERHCRAASLPLW